MNHVILLAGGIGTRMRMDIPKQFILVNEIPVFVYSLRKFLCRRDISTIVLVMADQWVDYAKSYIEKESFLQKIYFAKSGKSREHSVYNGLSVISSYASPDDIVFVHDSVRPLFPSSNIDDGIEACNLYDAALPVISVKDATYMSKDGAVLSSILPRDQLFSGQSPECFRFEKFYQSHLLLSDEEISKIRGCSELAYKTGLSVKLIPGTENNYKITTIEDLRAFELHVNKDN